jgi:TRAP-type C4-dicarboxylate transport system permease small subunit
MGIILQFLLEFLLQIIGEALIEVAFHKFSSQPLTRTLNTIVALVMYLALGILTGWFSTMIFPQSFIRSSKLHGISLIITPLLAGLTMSGIGWIRQPQEKQRIRLDTFGYAFVFAFGMALVRFLFTT